MSRDYASGSLRFFFSDPLSAPKNVASIMSTLSKTRGKIQEEKVGGSCPGSHNLIVRSPSPTMEVMDAGAVQLGTCTWVPRWGTSVLQATG